MFYGYVILIETLFEVGLKIVNMDIILSYIKYTKKWVQNQVNQQNLRKITQIDFNNSIIMNKLLKQMNVVDLFGIGQLEVHKYDIVNRKISMGG